MFAYGTRVGVASVSCYSRGLMSNHIFSLLEEVLCYLHISLLREYRVDQFAVAIYGSVQIVSLTACFHIRLINVPGAASLAFTFGAEALSNKWGEASFPIVYCFMCEFKPAHQEHLGQVSQAQLVP